MISINLNNKKILVTGAAGFIGFHLSLSLVRAGYEVWGLDSLNNYYDQGLKYDRLAEMGILKRNFVYNKIEKSVKYSNFSFIKQKLEDRINLPQLFKEKDFQIVFNLAAQVNVRHSLKSPEDFIDSNLVGFANVLECCRNSNVSHLLYASSSSVYGLNSKVPFSTEDRVDQPISLYAATKKSNELMAHVYGHLFNFSTTGLRFFNVYGPWGRPDMALSIFTDSILNDRPIQVYNEGNLERDFTYIDDVIACINAVLSNIDNLNSYSIYNIGCGNPINLLEFISELEEQLCKKALREMVEMQPGDVEKTWADVDAFEKVFDFQTKTSLKNGIENFLKWYKNYYKVQGT